MSRLLRVRVFTILAASLLVGYPLAICLAQNSTTESAPASNGNFRIAGTVVSATGGHPLGGVRVVIADVKNRRDVHSVVTSEDGHFEFHVNAGKYSLQAAKRGFIVAAYDQHEQFSTAIATGPDLATGDLVFRLAPAAVLTGKVIDESGDPVRHASVTVYRQDRLSGVTRIRFYRHDNTDDQGSYEITGLDGGTYFISVNAKPWYAMHASSRPGAERASAVVDSSLDVAYPVTYYADATEADDATPIPVRGGDHLEVDIHLTPVPALHVLFHAPDNGAQGVAWPMLEKPAFDGMDVVRPDNIQPISPGVYEMTGLAAGRYAVRMPGSAGDEMKEPIELNLTRDGQQLEMPSIESTSTVKATVQLLGGEPLPPKLIVQLQNAKGRGVWADVNAKGEAEFQNVVPGKYDVLAGTAGKAFAVVRIASPAGETGGRALDVPAGATLNVSLSLVGGSATVEGLVKRSGKPVAGAMVVLVPKNAESNHELFRRDQSDLDGSFSLQSVIPGTYTIVAIENAWDLDWADPALLEHYCKHGQVVTVGDHSKGSMTLPGPLEVQSRQ